MGGIDPETLGGTDIDTSTVHTAELPRIFGVFFNQNQNNILLDSSVRKALDIATNRTALIDEALAGQGKAIDTPISFKQKEAALWSDDAIQQAGKILDAAGWKLNTDTGIREKTAKGTVTPLSFTLTTADTIDLKVTAENLKSQWMKIGVDVTIQVYENGDLNQNIIRPRKYEALLFGEIIGRDYDLYPFWHSSERNDPGLNIALYTNIKTDKLLETLRTSSDTEIRTDALAEFIAEIQKDHPALFLYTPYYLYITRNTIQSIDINTITFGSERFLNVADWYIETNAVWSIFTKNKL